MRFRNPAERQEERLSSILLQLHAGREDHGDNSDYQNMEDGNYLVYGNEEMVLLKKTPIRRVYERE